MSARAFLTGSALVLGVAAFFALLVGGMWWADAQDARQRENRREAQVRAYERANAMCDAKPAAIVPHGGLTWWLEVKCIDGSVRAVPMGGRP